MDTTKIILTVISTIVAGMVPLCTYLIAKLKKKDKKIEETELRNEQYKEMINYGYGLIDMINQESIKVEPEIREAMRKASRRYHRLDLVKDKKQNEEEE